MRRQSDREKPMDRTDKEIPLSESNVSLKLEEIQRRCSELMNEPDALMELSLEEPVPELGSNDPYNRQRS